MNETGTICPELTCPVRCDSAKEIKDLAEASPLFILAGNGPYDNRGCEAIVRGTVRILRHHFGTPRFVVCSHFHNRNDVHKQQAQEIDTDILHEKIRHCYRRFDLLWFMTNILRRTFPTTLKHLFYKDLKPHLASARAVLALGGDNYSLDYKGRPIPTSLTQKRDSPTRCMYVAGPKKLRGPAA